MNQTEIESALPFDVLKRSFTQTRDFYT